MMVRSLFGMVAGVGTLLMFVGSAQAGTLRWTGNVDDTAVIRLNARDVRTRANRDGIRDSRSDIFGLLPDRPTRVRLSRVSGRGTIEVIEQPDQRNNYMAVVRIRDREPGSGRYGFVLDWSDEGGYRRDGDRKDWRDDRRRDDRNDRWRDRGDHNDDRDENQGDDGRDRARRP